MKGAFDVKISLNLAQERELHRLIDYERSLAEANADPLFRCAFPYRPDNDLQAELIDLKVLSLKQGGHGNMVVISSYGYSYFPEKARLEMRNQQNACRDVKLIAIAALFSAAAMGIGFLLGLLAR